LKSIAFGLDKDLNVLPGLLGLLADGLQNYFLTECRSDGSRLGLLGGPSPDPPPDPAEQDSGT
jgi:hypothetical protein